jgi:nucleotide-binding universal stress UspA family protein
MRSRPELPDMRYLVAVDGSPEADDALAYAAEVADAVGASLTLAYAVDPSVYDEGGSDPIASLSDADGRLVVESVEDAEEHGLDVLDEAAERAAQLGHDVETELLYGDPVDAIAEFVAGEECDAVFIGHRDRSERSGLLLGSVAKDVVGRATVPVTVV